jgi:hypothetical protein
MLDTSLETARMTKKLSATITYIVHQNAPKAKEIMAVNAKFSRNSAVAAAGVLFPTPMPCRQDATVRGGLDESLRLGIALCLFGN